MKRRSGVKTTSITGTLMAFKAGQPVGVVIEGHIFVSIYSTVKKLRESMRDLKVQDFEIKQINDGAEFIHCMAQQRVSVCLDPHPHGPTTRFQLILSGDPLQAADRLSSMTSH